MKTVSVSCVLALSLALGACGHYSDDLSSLDKSFGTTTTEYASVAPQDIMPAAGGAVSFHDSLAREYYTLARYENDVAYDYKASKLFTQKAQLASKGKNAVPSLVSSYSVPQKDAGELNAARAELIAALKDKNVPGNEVALAKAQASFDCWLERAEEARDETHYAACKNEFETSMASMVAPAAGAQELPPIDMGFPYNSTIVVPEDMEKLDKAAQFLSTEFGKHMTVFITAYAYPGNDQSRQLATSRALVINQALTQRGVPRDILKPQMASIETAIKTFELASGDEKVSAERFADVVQLHFVMDKPLPAPTKKSEEKDVKADESL